jgi:hypothetical protein
LVVNLTIIKIIHYQRKRNMVSIKTEGDYEKASERADEIYGAKPGTPEYQELQELLKALKKYEDDFVKMLKGFNQ